MQKTTPADLSQAECSKIIDFLDSHPVAVLATVDAAGNPTASPIYFAVSPELDVTFTTKRDTNKHNNIEKHSNVMMAVYDAESQTAVQISGNAVKVTDPETAQKIYHSTLHAAKQTGEDNVPPIAKIAAGPYVAYTIKPNNIWMSEYGWGNNFANALTHATDPANTSDPA